jgi:uncharacterized protein YeaO (DUF488 family)
MTIRIVRLGTSRMPDEGIRIGTVRRPPRGVPKSHRSMLRTLLRVRKAKVE